MAWNAAYCDSCWSITNPDRVPVRLVHPYPEKCARCGYATTSGIYVRLPGEEGTHGQG